MMNSVDAVGPSADGVQSDDKWPEAGGCAWWGFESESACLWECAGEAGACAKNAWETHDLPARGRPDFEAA